MRAHIPAAARGEPNRQCFQVFGFDVMLDANAKPWLLEVSRGQRGRERGRGREEGRGRGGVLDC